MSYRKPEQSLEEPLQKIMDGIEEFSKAATERIGDNEWSDEHRSELSIYVTILTQILHHLKKLQSDNW